MPHPPPNIDWAAIPGLRVIGDVHGDAAAFGEAIADAHDRGLFVVQLGDLVDRGPDSAGALRLAFSLRQEGRGLFLRGNHDDKLLRALQGNPVRRTGELGRTLAAIEAVDDGAAFREQVAGAIAAAPLWLHVGPYLMVHGAFHPAMLTAAKLDGISPRHTAKKVRYLALYGEGRMEADEDYPVRTYRWIDSVPEGLTVLIGHEMVSKEAIVARSGMAGGNVLFCDTGCGKGGKLSWVDLPNPAWRR